MGLTLREIRAATPEILAFAGVERFAELEVKHFSSGMMARLAFSVAFLAVRDVLILDEVYAVGDAGSPPANRAGVNLSEPPPPHSFHSRMSPVSKSSKKISVSGFPPRTGRTKL